MVLYRDFWRLATKKKNVQISNKYLLVFLFISSVAIQFATYTIRKDDKSIGYSLDWG